MLVAAHTTLPTFPDAPAAVRHARAHQPRLQYSHAHSAQRVHQQFAEALSASPALVIPDGHPILASPSAPLREKLLAAQLAHLASQHHRSEHNRLKFGAKGSPVVYIPLSVLQPEHVRQLQSHQEASCRRQAWWLSSRERNCFSKTPSLSLEPVADSSTIQNGTSNSRSGEASRVLPAVVSSPPAQLQQEITAAIEAPLNTTPCTIASQTMKTSETHPINISMLIPYEFLPVLASQLRPASPASPYMFYIPSKYYLDSITSVPIPGAHTLNSHSFPVYPSPLTSNPMFAPAVRPPQRVHAGIYPPSIIWSQPAGFDLLKSALSDVNNEHFPEGWSTRQCKREDADMPVPSPFFVPSQAAQFPPSPQRLMIDSPPIPVSGPMPLDLMDCQQTCAPYEMSLGIGYPYPPNPPSPPTGVIRRPRHERASSAPPTLAFPPLRSPHRKGYGGVEGRMPIMGNGNGHLKVCIPRNRSHPEDAFKVSPPPGIPAFVLEEKSIEQADVAIQSADELAGDAMRERSPFGTSLTQNPAFLKQSDERGQMLPPASPAHIWSNGSILSPKPCLNAPQTNPAAPKLGNLFLSSCPGKKVRLSGPVRGRGAICRDLRVDLTRIKELGVGCIVCCLDDNELDFLGASWTEYSSVANNLGIDVLRLPTPEGLAPLTPVTLDDHLTQLIRDYTLRGVPILAHCRGGVGRAGLIACCWLLKLGLCGWKDSDLCARTHSPVSATGSALGPMATEVPPALLAQAAAHGAGVCHATVQLVERAIAVVRRRRSLKAVETYEQVKFLVDFVEHLDAKSGPLSDIE